jgi:hypothetical protein
MSFHHLRRLTEHWPENTKALSPSVSLVAITITSHLNDKTNSFSMSSKSLSKWTNGLSRSTIDKAVKELAELGVLEVIRERQRAPRAFRLLVACPKGCERLKDHNTKRELAELYKQPETTEATKTELTSSSRLGNEFLQIGQGMSVDYATNRYQIETSNKKDDMKKSFEFLFITETLEALKASNEFTANHALLEAALTETPELIEEKAKAIQARAKHSPDSYLKASIKDSPKSLIPKQEQQTQSSQGLPKLRFGTLYPTGASSGELKNAWNKLKEHTPLVDWESLDKGHIDFLARLYKDHTPLNNTAASMISKAVREQLTLGDYDSPAPKSLTELGELLEQNRERVKGY